MFRVFNMNLRGTITLRELDSRLSRRFWQKHLRRIVGRKTELYTDKSCKNEERYLLHTHVFIFLESKGFLSILEAIDTQLFHMGANCIQVVKVNGALTGSKRVILQLSTYI